MTGAVLKYSLLTWKMVRFKVAVMLFLFLLIGAARHDGLSRFHLSYLWAILALSAGYVSATSVNDLSDRRIDLVNHPNSPGKPLASGLATERQLVLLNVSSAGGAAAFASAIGRRELLIVLLALAMGYAYSLKPLLLSHRTFATPIVLSAFYVAVPYSLGAAIAGRGPHAGDVSLLAALLVLFFARSLLKDFRDREGDCLYEKATFLLRYGKGATCAASAAAVVAGDLLLIPALHPPLAVGLLLQLFPLGVLWALHRLWASEGLAAEQSAIGLAAKTGNGLIISVLGLLLLGWRGAPVADLVVLTSLVLAVYGIAFYVLVTRPQEVVIGYRG